jgi:PPK2 family polyphosphate:nucleotide phosphotransferase
VKPDLRSELRVPVGPVTLAGYDSSSTPLAERGKKGHLSLPTDDGDALRELAERLYADASVGGKRSVLLVLQGMDTSGKGGTTDHVVSTIRPTSVRYHAFKAPTDEERKHDFLWRIRQHVPLPGELQVFDRSHYEDVLIVRVHNLGPEAEWSQRYHRINDFESELAAAGTTIVKCFLHVSFDTQRERLLARLDDPTKHWKFNPADVDERQRWTDYVTAYEAALEKCNTPQAPWYVVPADSKKYRNWAVGRLLRETLAELDPQWPQPDLDIDLLRERLRPPN